jgi:hypothetical protein
MGTWGSGGNVAGRQWQDGTRDGIPAYCAVSALPLSNWPQE